MDARLLESLGLSTGLPAAEKAAGLVRRLPLRNDTAVASRDPVTVLETRWFAGSGECLHVLGELYRGTTRRGGAFGVSWPFLEGGGRIVAPALPVAATADESVGPDGSYDVSHGFVWREAVGTRSPFLALAGAADEIPGGGFDLLWFGDGERLQLREGVLVIEDLFCMLRVPASAALIDRLLVRALRVDPEVADGLSFGAPRGPAVIEVRRQTALLGSARWRDAAALLRVRADVEAVEERGDRIELRTSHEHNVIFTLVQDPAGWRIVRGDGEFPYPVLSLMERDGVLQLTAAIDPSIDPLGPGVRGRIAFDLRSNLVALAH